MLLCWLLFGLCVCVSLAVQREAEALSLDCVGRTRKNDTRRACDLLCKMYVCVSDMGHLNHDTTTTATAIIITMYMHHNLHGNITAPQLATQKSHTTPRSHRACVYYMPYIY